ncbi:hypothetical protein DEU37_2154 [Microbacterium sp. AG790]|uniref:hypothetical protein n=1 Tax=Microbacterium sp. AG790 TaxID=2183995 RepID=UPI000F105942|nr:hypothetical protein [Microbacterium sp. AG790]RKS88533.1 hypothetical protein DEU37_2154 [Microbacterium sp. AG790]
MLDDVLGTLLGGAIGDVIGHVIKAPFIRAKQSRGKMRAALRVEWGSHDGLTTAWRRGNVRIRPGFLEFRGHEIRVLSVSDAARSPAVGEWLQVHTDSQIYSVATPSARLLWAVPGPQSAWALSRLAHPCRQEPHAADES